MVQQSSTCGRALAGELAQATRGRRALRRPAAASRSSSPPSRWPAPPAAASRACSTRSPRSTGRPAGHPAARPPPSRTPASGAASTCADELLDWLGVSPRRRFTRESALDANDEVALRGMILLDLPDVDSVEPQPPRRGRPAAAPRRRRGLDLRPAEVRRPARARGLPAPARRLARRPDRRAQPDRQAAARPPAQGRRRPAPAARRGRPAKTCRWWRRRPPRPCRSCRRPSAARSSPSPARSSPRRPPTATSASPRCARCSSRSSSAGTPVPTPSTATSPRPSPTVHAGRRPGDPAADRPAGRGAVRAETSTPGISDLRAPPRAAACPAAGRRRSSRPPGPPATSCRPRSTRRSSRPTPAPAPSLAARWPKRADARHDALLYQEIDKVALRYVVEPVRRALATYERARAVDFWCALKAHAAAPPEGAANLPRVQSERAAAPRWRGLIPRADNRRPDSRRGR